MVLDIKKNPNSVLRKKAKEVKKVDKKIIKFIDDMFETMAENKGCGLAAPQVGVSKRIIAIDLEGQTINGKKFALINPKIIKKSWAKIEDNERCLSIPDTEVKVKRSKNITVIGIDKSKKKITIKAKGLTARALQHEIDHLDGILIIDK
ncbi:MAG: peptide deformylase [Patescibacteria group bacterium]|nr:peptide deformylase [Patescibacteria group bacterium]